MKPKVGKTGLVLTCSLAVIVMAGCAGQAPGNPMADAVSWKTYSNPVVGYAVKYPDVYRLEEHEGGRDVLFRYDGYPVLVINYVDETESRNRGLWAKHRPSGTTEVGSLQGRLYRYNHYDGPFFMPTVSHVVPHGDRFLGLEFRTDRDELDDVQRRILRSFHFTDSGI